MWNAVLDESQAEVKIAWKSINNLIQADDITLMAENEEKLKSLLIRVKEKSENVDWNSTLENHGVWSHHFMAYIIGKCGSSGILYFLWIQNHCRL